MTTYHFTSRCNYICISHYIYIIFYIIYNLLLHIYIFYKIFLFAYWPISKFIWSFWSLLQFSQVSSTSVVQAIERQGGQGFPQLTDITFFVECYAASIFEVVSSPSLKSPIRSYLAKPSPNFTGIDFFQPTSWVKSDRLTFNVLRCLVDVVQCAASLGHSGKAGGLGLTEWEIDSQTRQISSMIFDGIRGYYFLLQYITLHVIILLKYIIVFSIVVRFYGISWYYPMFFSYHIISI